MTTYKTKDGIEYQRYEKFTIKWIATLYWIPLLIGENRVRYFESSQLVEIPDPRLTGMVYGCEPPPEDQHWLDVQQARIEWNWKHVFVTPEQAASINAVDNVRLCVVRNPAPVVSLYTESMRTAA